MLDPKFVAELMETTLTVVKSSTDGGSYETFKAKMFLASTTEVGLANENNIAEGSPLRYSATTPPASLILRRNA